MSKPYFSVVNQDGGKVPQVKIYGVIGDSRYYAIGEQARYFRSEMEWLAENNPRIDVHINSPGGSVLEGLAIANAISSSDVEVHTYNDGIAYSMAAIILMAGHKIHLAKGSMVMFHAAGSTASGNANDLREQADVLEKYDQLLTTIIAGRTGKTEEAVKAEWMDYKDHYLTAKDMMEQKLADVLEDYDTKDTPANVQDLSRDQVMAFYRERSEDLSPDQLQRITNQVKDLIDNPNSNMKNTGKILALATVGANNANLETILAEANAALTENGITNYGIYPESIVTDAHNQTVENTRLKGELETVTNRANTAEASVTDLQNQLAAAQTTINNQAAKIVAFGKAPGANFKPVSGDDTQPDPTDGADVEALLANMPHNKAADGLLN